MSSAVLNLSTHIMSRSIREKLNQICLFVGKIADYLVEQLAIQIKSHVVVKFMQGSLKVKKNSLFDTYVIYQMLYYPFQCILFPLDVLLCFEIEPSQVYLDVIIQLRRFMNRYDDY